ncbi:MAG: DegT/DnrJ/EryC1/StrS aminotransferase family protein [Proteobacteria bacterium]|nr:DegT/DnrJ/EryC1/StrS aminotransferase family protein [Pseudomonadota bacterium]
MITVYPELDLAALRANGAALSESVLAGRDYELTSSGRAAIARALTAFGIDANDEVLVPAYCCLAMTAPIQARGARPVFYQLREDLSFDVQHLQAHLTSRTRAVIAVHYFGAASDLDALRLWCDSHQLILLEDCAHAFYTQIDSRLVGSVGHAGIASIMKFLPSYDGGALWFNAAPRRPLVQLPPRSSSLREYWSLLERSRLPGASCMRLVSRVRAHAMAGASSAEPPKSTMASATDGGLEFDPASQQLAASASAAWLLRRDSARRIKNQRCEHFEQLARAIRTMPGVRVFWSELPAGAVPYVLPCLFDRGDIAFASLRASGIQVFRWEFTEQHGCETTRRYARSLLQLPVHQALGHSQLLKLSNAIRAAAQAA